MNDFLKLPQSWPRRLGLLALSIFFVGAGANHFINTGFYMRIMPPYLPIPYLLVLISGVFEILGGLGVLPHRTRKWAGYGLIALMFAVLPANIYMAQNPVKFAFISSSPLLHWLRIPLQFLAMIWVYWATRPEVPEASETNEPGS